MDESGLIRDGRYVLKPSRMMTASRRGDFEVRRHHFPHQRIEAYLRLPAPTLYAPWSHRPTVSQPRPAGNSADRLSRQPAVSECRLPVRRDLHCAIPDSMPKRTAARVTNSRTECCSPEAMTKSSGSGCCNMSQLGSHIVPCMAPVAQRMQIPQVQTALQTRANRASPRVICVSQTSRHALAIHG